MEAFLAYVTLGNGSWNFENSAMMVYRVQTWVEKWKKIIIETVNVFENQLVDYQDCAIATEMIREIMQGVFTGTKVEGIPTTNLMAQNLKKPVPNAHCSEWNSLVSMLLNNDEKVKDVITQYYNIIQGNLKSSQVFIRATEFNADVRKIQKTKLLIPDEQILLNDPIPQRREIREIYEKIYTRISKVAEAEKEKANRLMEQIGTYLEYEDIDDEDIEDLIDKIRDLLEESFSLCSRLTSFSVKKIDRIPENCFSHDIYLESVRMECKAEIADSAFTDCRRLSDIEYGQWNFSDTEDIFISDVPMRKKERPFFRIKVILKNEPRLESEIVMEKAKRLYEYIAEHSVLQKEISSIIPDEIINSILNGSLPVLPHEDLGLTVDESELIHYVDHAVLYKEVGEGQYISVKGKLYLFSNKIGFYGGSDTHEILLDDIATVMEFEGSPTILEVLTNRENLYISTTNTDILFKALHTIESSKNEENMEYTKIETTIEKMIEGADLDSYIFYFEDVQHSQIKEDMEKQIGILIEKLHKLSAALEKYPDKVEGTHRFSTYYLPETLRLIFAYQQYLMAGVSKDKIDKVYDKVMESIDTVIVAVESKIDSIYQVATMDTVAKANALQKIMGQDGYTKGDGPLKH